MPVDDIRSDFHDITWIQFASGKTFLLVVAATGSTQQQLTARMAVTIIAASRFERHVIDRYFQILIKRQRSQI